MVSLILLEVAMKRIDLTGQKFHRLTAVEYVGNRKWRCICDCGKETVVGAYELKSGNTKSCGCLNIERITQMGKNNKGRPSKRKGIHTPAYHFKHNLRHTRLYSIWCNMKTRCYNANTRTYKDYGARGIAICEEWRKDFKCFYDWAMSNGYNEDLTIERLDYNKDYCPENCTWITRKGQNNNTRRNVIVEWNGETHTAKQWEEITGLPIQQRLKKYKWSVEKAFTTPLKTRKLNSSSI